MGFGNDAQSETEMAGGFEEEFQIKEPGEYTCRFLVGVVRVRRLFIPVIAVDKETREEKSSTRVIIRPPKKDSKGKSIRSFFNVLASIDIGIKNSMGIDKPKTIFDANDVFAYLGIYREDDTPRVRPMFMKYSVVEQIQDFNKQKSKKKEGRLMYGLYFMYDMIVKRIQEKGKSAQFGTSYNVMVDTDNPWANKCSELWLPKQSGLPKGFDPLDKEFSENHKGFPAVFSDDDIDLIDTFCNDRGLDEISAGFLRDLYTPATDEDLAEFFTNNRIDMDAKFYGTENPIFPDPERFLREMDNHPGLENLKLQIEYKVEDGVGKVVQDIDVEFDDKPEQKKKSEPKSKGKSVAEEVKADVDDGWGNDEDDSKPEEKNTPDEADDNDDDKW